jgi:hypothetical protein
MVKVMVTKKRLWQIVLVSLALFGAAKVMQPPPYHPDRTPKMNDIPPRIAALFEKTRPICFGRFMIDVPERALVVWGPTMLPDDFVVYPGDAPKIRAEIQARVNEITNKGPHKTEPSMLVGVFDSVNPESKIVVGYADYAGTGSADFYSYIRLGQTLFLNYGLGAGLTVPDTSDLYGFRSDKMAYKEIVEEYRDFARRLRLRAEDDAPEEPGVCIREGFISTGLDYKETELVSVGFRFPEYPDVTVSIMTRSTDDPNEDETLDAYLARGLKRAQALDMSELYRKIRTLRKGDRAMGPWTGGEVMGRMPGRDGGPSVHEFIFKTAGTGKDYTRPVTTVQLHTGVQENEKASVRPSLTDDEAVALWDKLTTTIRVRPVREAPASNQAEEAKP